MLLEVLPSRHEKPPLMEYPLLRTSSTKVFLKKAGEKHLLRGQRLQLCRKLADVEQLQDIAVKPHMVS